MDQWLGCLAPVCQLALKRAHDTVLQRGGQVVTPEDLLLALLDIDTSLAPFLVRCGVDLDELVRTIQGEQPLSPPSGTEAGLSDPLVDWFAHARERYSQPWINTHHLLSTLVHGAERFQDKAYVAVLERVPVSAWDTFSPGPVLPEKRTAKPPAQQQEKLVRSLGGSAFNTAPMSSSAHDIATGVVAQLLEPRGGVIWLQTPSSLPAEALLGQVRRMTLSVVAAGLHSGVTVKRRWYQVEWESAGEEESALDRLFQAMRTHCREAPVPPVFLFPRCSPAVMTLLVQRIGILKWRHLMAVEKPLILLISPSLKYMATPEQWLEDNLGLQLKRFVVPLLSSRECLRYLRFCQPEMERKWHVEITEAALQAATCLARTRDTGTLPDESDTDPEKALELLREALHAKATLQANGPATIADLKASREDLERRYLVAEARGESTDELVRQLDQVALELAAEEVHWHEQTVSTASVLTRDDVLRQARRSPGAPLVGRKDCLEKSSGRTRRESMTAPDQDSPGEP